MVGPVARGHERAQLADELLHRRDGEVRFEGRAVGPLLEEKETQRILTVDVTAWPMQPGSARERRTCSSETSLRRSKVSA
jgi:hypothetical protein